MCCGGGGGLIFNTIITVNYNLHYPQIKSYRNTAMSVCLHLLFLHHMVTLSSCDRLYGWQNLKYLLFDSYKKFSDLFVNCENRFMIIYT